MNPAIAPDALKRLPREESYKLNEKERDERREVLAAPPRLVTLGTHNSCNAKCIFCLEGDYPRFDLPRYKEFFEGRMGHFIRQAEKVTFTGFGEVLWLPDAVELLDYLNETIPETWKIFTTNGTPLVRDINDRLLKSKYVIQVSLHASKPELHQELTLLPGAFKQIVGSVGELCRLRRERELGDSLHLVIVDVVTRKNAADLPDLIQMAWDLKVPEVQCNYVTLYDKGQIELSCFFDQRAANEAIDRAREVLARIERSADPEEFKHFEVRLPQKFGQERAGEAETRVCGDPWEHIYVEGQGPVLPCCMWGEHIGNLEKGDEVDAIWNGELYRSLRSGMAGGKPHEWCSRCVNYRGYNVDSLLCHLTNRPEQQRVLIEEIEKRGLV